MKRHKQKLAGLLMALGLTAVLPSVADEVVARASGGWFATDSRAVKDTTLSGDAMIVGVTTATLTYSADRCGGDTVLLAADGATLAGAEALAGEGTYDWTPDKAGIIELTHTVVTSGVPVVQTAAFDVAMSKDPLIFNVTARQRYPWNGKVDIAYTAFGVAKAAAAQDMAPGLKVMAVDRTTTPWTTNVADSSSLFVGPYATEVLADAAATSDGAHRIVWDMNAQGLTFVSTNTIFVIAGVAKSFGGVQLWAGGPYWAESNVGASRPEEYGYYFWWGDTVGYKRNAANNGWDASDGSETGFLFSKDNAKIATANKDLDALTAAGYIDCTGNLVAEHDAATKHLGTPWRMPTEAEIQALIDNCTFTRVVKWNNTNVNGFVVTGKGDYASKSIFLPAASSGFTSQLSSLGLLGYYWSSSPNSDDSVNAWYLYFGLQNNIINRTSYLRYFGQSVRPVRTVK